MLGARMRVQGESKRTFLNQAMKNQKRVIGTFIEKSLEADHPFSSAGDSVFLK